MGGDVQAGSSKGEDSPKISMKNFLQQSRNAIHKRTLPGIAGTGTVLAVVLGRRGM